MAYCNNQDWFLIVIDVYAPTFENVQPDTPIQHIMLVSEACVRSLCTCRYCLRELKVMCANNSMDKN